LSSFIFEGRGASAMGEGSFLSYPSGISVKIKR